jgi:hypothetical protein
VPTFEIEPHRNRRCRTQLISGVPVPIRTSFTTVTACVCLALTACGGDDASRTDADPSPPKTAKAAAPAVAATPMDAAATIAAATRSDSKNPFVTDDALRDPGTGGVAAFVTLREVLDPASTTPPRTRCEQVAGLDPTAPDATSSAFQVRRNAEGFTTDGEISFAGCEAELRKGPGAAYAQLFTPTTNLKWARYESGGCGELGVVRLPGWLLAFRNAGPKVEDAQKWEAYCVGQDNATKRWLVTGATFLHPTLAEALRNALGEVPDGLPEEADPTVATITTIADPKADPDVLAAGKVSREMFGSSSGRVGTPRCRQIADSAADELTCDSIEYVDLDPDVQPVEIAARVSGVSDSIVDAYQKDDHLLLGYGPLGEEGGARLAFVKERGAWKLAEFNVGSDSDPSHFAPLEDEPDDFSGVDPPVPSG